MSEKNLDKLIASLKSEAIDAADKESKKILDAAEEKAQKIIQEAEQKREQILNDAETEAKAIVEKGESALRQAARDLSIAVRNDLIQLFEAVLEREVRKEFTPDLLKTAFVKVLENIGSHVELKLPEEFEQELADYIHQHLQGANGLVSITKENSNLKKLSITKTDEGWSYQISPEAVAELLQSHLIEKWVKLLKKDKQT